MGHHKYKIKMKENFYKPPETLSKNKEKKIPLWPQIEVYLLVALKSSLIIFILIVSAYVIKRNLEIELGTVIVAITLTGLNFLFCIVIVFLLDALLFWHIDSGYSKSYYFYLGVASAISFVLLGIYVVAIETTEYLYSASYDQLIPIIPNLFLSCLLLKYQKQKLLKKLNADAKIPTQTPAEIAE